MSQLDELLTRIFDAPEGPDVVACFDYDGTLIGGYSATVFYEHRLRTLDIGPIELARTLLLSARAIRTEADFDALLALSLAAWRDREETELEDLGERLFKGAIAARLHGEVWELLEAHRQMGRTLVLASSATRFQPGVAFVERGNTGQARRALEPAVAKIIDDRLSLVISPEGTRSRTPKLGPFKKGAFHIAMQAGVPMVPVVLRGAGEAMRRGDQTIRPGTVEVIVLPPVDTSTWRTETIGDHVAEVRGAFEMTLASWPGAPSRPALPASTS